MITIQGIEVFSDSGRIVRRRSNDTYFKRATVLKGETEADFEEVDAMPDAELQKELAEAVGAETDAFMKRYNALEEEIQRLNKKVDDLYARLHAVETDNLALLRENGELKVALKEAETKEDVEAYDHTAGYPEKLDFTV